MKGGILGIDPGSVSAAFAYIGKDGVAGVGDLAVASSQLDPAAMARLVRELAPRAAVVERVGAMPKQGLASTFRFGYAAGIIHGVLASCDVPIVFVAPAVWKRYFRLLGKEKERSRSLAIQRYPTVAGLHRKKDHGRAEALLMVEWYQHEEKRP